MFCEKCGKELENGVCPQCTNKKAPAASDSRCLPAFILGLIGSIFGLFGGICTTMCSVGLGSSNSAFIFIFGGSVLGLIGACLCLNKVKTGAILEAAAALMIIIRAFSGGADFMTVIALLLLAVAAVIGLAQAFLINRK